MLYYCLVDMEKQDYQNGMEPLLENKKKIYENKYIKLVGIIMYWKTA